MKILLCGLLIFLALGSTCSEANDGITAFENGQYEQAQQLFSLQLKSQPNLANYYLGRLAFVNDQLDQGEQYFEKSLKLQPNDVLEHYWFARLKYRQRQNASIFTLIGIGKGVHKHYQKALDIAPQHLASMIGLAEFYVSAPSMFGGSIDKARALQAKISALSAAAAITLELSIERQQEHDPKALTIARTIVTKHGDSISALAKAGAFFQETGHYKESIDAFKQLQTLKAKTYDQQLHQLTALYQIGRSAVFAQKQLNDGINALTSYRLKKLPKQAISKEWAELRLAQLYGLDQQKPRAKTMLTQLLSSDDDILRDRVKSSLKKL